MKGKKNATVGHLDIDSEILEELFPSGNSDILHDFDESVLSAIGRIISYASAMGGMVTFYRRSDDDATCISVRVGQRKRSLVLYGDDADEQFLGGLADTFGRAYLSWKQLGEATKLAEEAAKVKKKKS